MEKYPITARSLERHYRIEGDKFERQYKEHLSGFYEWDQLDHAEEWMVFERNIGERLSIDETSLSKGELYTIITNKDADNKARAIARRNGEDYVPYTFDNGDTRKELLARSRYVLFKSPEKWTQSQRERAEIMFTRRLKPSTRW